MAATRAALAGTGPVQAPGFKGGGLWFTPRNSPPILDVIAHPLAENGEPIWRGRLLELGAEAVGAFGFHPHQDVAPKQRRA